MRQIDMRFKSIGKDRFMEIGGHIFMLAVIIFVFVDAINTIKVGMLDFDGSWNATVAANVARGNGFRISYPDDTVFYNMITTGPLVLVPTGVLYKLFGINSITSSLIPLLYGILGMFFSYILLCRCLPKNKYKNLCVAFLVSCVYLSDNLFEYITTNLVGESACLFFVILSILFLEKYFEKKNPCYLVLMGASSVFAFLTKSSMIFIFVTFIGMIVFETLIMKRIDFKAFVAFIGGLFAGFVVGDSYKLIQLGGVKNYLAWWKAEWGNMFTQSSGEIDRTLAERLGYLPSIFTINKWWCVAIIFAPIIIYLVAVIKRFMKKIDTVPGTVPMSVMGLAGSSLLVYFLMFGKDGLFYARRHEVNELIIKLYAAYIVAFLLIYVFEAAQKEGSQAETKKCALFSFIAGMMFISVFANQNTINGVKRYMYKAHERSYEAQLMTRFLDTVDSLDPDAVLYCNGWWQEPEISLMLDREMVSVYDVTDGKAPLDTENGYFIVGRRFDYATTQSMADMLGVRFVEVDDIEVDYTRCYPFNSLELFSVYKIEAK